MVHGLHIVTVEVAQEDAVVAGVVLGMLGRGVQHFGAEVDGGGEEGVDDGPIVGPERQVRFAEASPVAWRPSQKSGNSVPYPSTSPKSITRRPPIVASTVS